MCLRSVAVMLLLPLFPLLLPTNQPDVFFPHYAPPAQCVDGCAPWSVDQGVDRRRWGAEGLKKEPGYDSCLLVNSTKEALKKIHVKTDDGNTAGRHWVDHYNTKALTTVGLRTTSSDNSVVPPPVPFVPPPPPSHNFPLDFTLASVPALPKVHYDSEWDFIQQPTTASNPLLVQYARIMHSFPVDLNTDAEPVFNSTTIGEAVHICVLAGNCSLCLNFSPWCQGHTPWGTVGPLERGANEDYAVEHFKEKVQSVIGWVQAANARLGSNITISGEHEHREMVKCFLLTAFVEVISLRIY